MDERELAQLLRRAGNQVTPGPAPVGRIVREGDALRRQQRHGRVVLVRAAAIAAAVVGGGSLAATVIDWPAVFGGNASETSGDAGAVADEDSGPGGGEEAAGGSAEDGGTDSGLEAERGRATEDSLAAADADPSVVSPGDVVAVRDADDPDDRLDVVWRMERRVDDGWVDEFRLAAAVRGAPTWWIEGEDHMVPDVGSVESPARLVIPPVAAAGEYRVCEEQGGAEAQCAFLTVRG